MAVLNFFSVNFSLCMYLSIVNFSGHEITIVDVVVVVVGVVLEVYRRVCELTFRALGDSLQSLCS